MTERVRVYAVANLRTGSIHGMTCDVNRSAAWVRELTGRYADPLAAVQCVDLVDPDEQGIQWSREAVDGIVDTARRAVEEADVEN